MGDIGLGHDLTDPSAKSAHDGGGHAAVRQASRCGKTARFRSKDIPRTPMTAVIRAEREGERGRGCVRRLRLFVSRMLAAAALFLEGRADPHRDQHGPGRDGGSRAGQDSKRSVRRDSAGEGQNGQSSRSGTGRRKDKGGKAGDDGLEFMREMAGGPGTRLAISLLAGLMLPFSGAPNAVYGLPDMYRLLLSACSREGGESSAEAQYQRSRALKDIKRLPSRRRMLDIIKGVRRDHMLSRCRDMVTRSMVRARRHGMLRRPVDVAIDEHDIPSYARVLGMTYAVFSKYKKGAKKFHRLATLHCVVRGHRLTLGVEAVRRGDDAAGTVRRLLWRARRRGIRMSSITVDRGFHSVDVIEAIKAMGMPLVMPAVRLARIKGAIKEYGAGERDAVSAHTMTNSAGRSASYTLAILEREDLERKYAKMSQEDRRLADLHDKDARVRQHCVFATTMGMDWIGGDPHRVAEFYRRRWGIENSYKSYEAMRPRTTSTDYSVRILLWFIPFILYNVWILARFMAARGRACTGARPPATLNLFVSMLLDAANMQPAGNPGGRPPD